MTVALYEIAEMRTILDSWLAESEGELTPELEALLAEVDEKADAKIERVALYVRERKAHAAAVKEERDRLDALVKRETRAAESLTDYLHRQMTALGKDRVNGVLCTVALQKNPPAVVGDVSPETLKDAWQQGETKFIRHIPESFALDRKSVVDAFKAGQPIPDGLTVEQGQSVRIR